MPCLSRRERPSGGVRRRAGRRGRKAAPLVRGQTPGALVPRPAPHANSRALRQNYPLEAPSRTTDSLLNHARTRRDTASPHTVFADDPSRIDVLQTPDRARARAPRSNRVQQVREAEAETWLRIRDSISDRAAAGATKRDSECPWAAAGAAVGDVGGRFVRVSRTRPPARPLPVRRARAAQCKPMLTCTTSDHFHAKQGSLRFSRAQISERRRGIL